MPEYVVSTYNVMHDESHKGHVAIKIILSVSVAACVVVPAYKIRQFWKQYSIKSI